MSTARKLRVTWVYWLILLFLIGQFALLQIDILTFHWSRFSNPVVRDMIFSYGSVAGTGAHFLEIITTLMSVALIGMVLWRHDKAGQFAFWILVPIALYALCKMIVFNGSPKATSHFWVYFGISFLGAITQIWLVGQGLKSLSSPAPVAS